MSHYMFSTSSWCRSMRLSEPTTICFWHTEVGQQQGYLQHKVLHPRDPEFTGIYIILIYIASIYPLALHCRPGSFRTWLCFSSVTSRDCQFWQVALVFRLESVNQSNLAKLAIAAPFRGILTDWLANWLIFRHLNFKKCAKTRVFCTFWFAIVVILQVRNSLIPFVRKIRFGDVHFLNGQFRNFDLRDLMLWLWAQRCHECRVHCKQSSLLCFHSLSHLWSQQVSRLSSFQLAINPRSNEHPFKQHPSTHFSKVILLCFAGYCSLTSEAEKSFQKWQAI